MYESNQWIVMQYDYGIPFWAKPPLSTWLSAISFNVFGINEFAARLPSFIIGLVIIGLLTKIKEIKKVDVFFIAFVLLTIPEFLLHMIDGTMLNKPIVYTNGIAMQDFLNRGNAISADTPTEFAYALEKIILDYEMYQIQSSEVSKLFENQFKISQKIINSLIK